MTLKWHDDVGIHCKFFVHRICSHFRMCRPTQKWRKQIPLISILCRLNYIYMWFVSYYIVVFQSLYPKHTKIAYFHFKTVFCRQNVEFYWIIGNAIITANSINNIAAYFIGYVMRYFIFPLAIFRWIPSYTYQTQQHNLFYFHQGYNSFYKVSSFRKVKCWLCYTSLSMLSKL